MCNFYSKLRTIENQNKDYYKNSITYNIVFSEVVDFIKKALKTSQRAPTVILQSYQRYTGTLGDLQSTWLKEKFISKIPDNFIHVENNGWGYNRSSASLAILQCNDDLKALVQVAKPIRQDLVNNENELKFNFQKDSQNNFQKL